MFMSPHHQTKDPKLKFECACDAIQQQACEGLPFYRKYKGKQYCVLHLPTKDKSDDFNKVVEEKLSNETFNFQGVWFPGSWPFGNHHFNKRADFSYAVFNERVYFGKAIFYEDAK